jgi:hypothetical protein
MNKKTRKRKSAEVGTDNKTPTMPHALEENETKHKRQRHSSEPKQNDDTHNLSSLHPIIQSAD